MHNIQKKKKDFTMRHCKKGRKLNRDSAHRRLMLHNLAVSILKHSQVKTTLAKAKEVRRTVEKLVTWGKKNTVHNQRLAFKILRDRTLLKKLFDKISKDHSLNIGGCTRIVKDGFRRGDCAPMSIIQLVNK